MIVSSQIAVSPAHPRNAFTIETLEDLVRGLSTVSERAATRTEAPPRRLQTLRSCDCASRAATLPFIKENVSIECDDRHTEGYAFWFNLRRRSNELGSLTSGGSVRRGANRFKSAMTIGPRPRRHRARRVVNWIDANS